MALQTLIWLFPLVFMFHDFEEIILGEPWLRRNAAGIRQGLDRRTTPRLGRQIGALLDKSTPELNFTVSLIFALTVLAAFLAAEYGRYGLFLLASGAFFLHGFMHLGQAILLRRYVPAVISSLGVVLPYGWVLFGRLLQAGIVDRAGLVVYLLAGLVLIVPLILGMHRAAGWLYPRLVRALVGQAGDGAVQ